MDDHGTFSLPDFLEDENANFVTNVLSKKHVEIIKEILVSHSYTTLCVVNSFIPMDVQTIEQILTIIIKFKYAKSKTLLEPIIRLAVHINRHYTNTFQIKKMIEIMKLSFEDEATLRLFDQGMMALFSGTSQAEYSDLIDTLHETGISNKKFFLYLEAIYEAGHDLGLITDTNIADHIERLHACNYLIQVPKFTSIDGISLYAENLKDLSIGVMRKSNFLFTTRTPATLYHIYNDILYILAAWNMIFNYQKETKRLQIWIQHEINSLMEPMFLAYYQIPSTKEIILDIAALIANMNLVPPEADYSSHFRLIIQRCFDFVEIMIKHNLHIIPSFLKSHIIAFEESIKRAPEGTDLSYFLSDDYDNQTDDFPRELDFGKADNILCTPDFFAFTQDDIVPFGILAQMPICYDKVTDVEDDDILQTEYETTSNILLPINAISVELSISLNDIVPYIKEQNGLLTSSPTSSLDISVQDEQSSRRNSITSTISLPIYNSEQIDSRDRRAHSEPVGNQRISDLASILHNTNL